MTVNAPRVSDIRRKQVHWLWKGYSAFGKLTVLDGDPDLGKSTLLCDITARCTTGRPLPYTGDEHRPFNVLMLSAEDDIGDTIRPRLEAAEGDISRVTVLQDVNGKPPEFPRDFDAIRRLIEEDEVRLVTVDPFMAFLSSKVDSSRDQDIRGGVMYPLKQLAEETGVAVIFTRHLNKMGGSHPLYRGGGSIGIIGAVRSGLLVAPDPNDESRSILAVSKSNLSAQRPALAYRLTDNAALDVATVTWEGATDHKASQLLAISTDEEKGALGEAMEFLRDVLDSGAMGSKEVLKQARDAGVSERTLRRAKKDLRVVARKVGAVDSRDQHWTWELPEHYRAPESSPATSPTVGQVFEDGQQTPEAAKAAMPLVRTPSENGTNIATETPRPSWPSSEDVGSLREETERPTTGNFGEKGNCSLCDRVTFFYRDGKPLCSRCIGIKEKAAS